MKIIRESKEQLPIDFITQTVSEGWAEVGKLKSSIDGIKQTFTKTKKVEEILQDLIDAYLIAIGQLENCLDNKNYLDFPEEEKDSDALTEDAKLDNIKDGFEEIPAETTKTEVFTELPDYDVEVEQKGEKVEIELTPKDLGEVEGEFKLSFDNDKKNLEASDEDDVYNMDFEEPGEFDEEARAAFDEWLERSKQYL